MANRLQQQTTLKGMRSWSRPPIRLRRMGRNDLDGRRWDDRRSQTQRSESSWHYRGARLHVRGARDEHFTQGAASTCTFHRCTRTRGLTRR